MVQGKMGDLCLEQRGVLLIVPVVNKVRRLVDDK